MLSVYRLSVYDMYFDHIFETYVKDNEQSFVGKLLKKQVFLKQK